MTLRNKSARDSFRTTSEAAALKRAFFGVANFSFLFPFLGLLGGGFVLCAEQQQQR